MPGTKDKSKMTKEERKQYKEEKKKKREEQERLEKEELIRKIEDEKKKEEILKQLQNPEHKFWKTQPVPQSIEEKIPEKLAEIKEKKNKEIPLFGPLENRTLKDVRQDPLPLPPGYEWYELDINDEKDLEDLYDLLRNHYVEDVDSTFRFNYSKKFLQWALTPPNWKKQWHVGVRVTDTKKIVAFISAIPCQIALKSNVPVLPPKQENATSEDKPQEIVEEKEVEIVKKSISLPMVEINFLCVRKELRAKRLAPVLIKEVTRRVNLTDVWQAIYTAGVEIPTPISNPKYYHRSLNPRKLVEIGFTGIPRNLGKAFKDPMSALEAKLSLPEKTVVPGFRKMKKGDIPEAYQLLKEYLGKFEVAAEYTLEEFKHWMTYREEIVYSFVVEQEIEEEKVEENGEKKISKKKKITDFVSFYHLPSSVLENEKHTDLKAAYLYFYASTKTPMKDLIQDVLITAKNLGYDVFNALDIQDNLGFIEDLQFGVGDGYLHYYVFNWNMPLVHPSKIGLVMF